MPLLVLNIFSTDLEDIVLIGQEVLHHEAVLGGLEEVGHLVVVGVPCQPRLDDELIGALDPGGQTVPADLDTGQGDLQ